jgi:hypothetical protein
MYIGGNSNNFVDEVTSGTSKRLCRTGGRRDRRSKGWSGKQNNMLVARLYNSAMRDAEIEEKHGKVRVLVKDGKPVEVEVKEVKMPG